MRSASTHFGPLRRSRRRLASWLAVLALVVNALAPTLAQAVVTGSGQGDWVQVCSVTGVAWVRVGDGLDAASRTAGQPFGHSGDPSSSMKCPWCGLHGGAPGMPSAVSGWEPAHVPASMAWPAFSSANRTSVLHLGAPARAPPSAS
jgi:hypothetical protein